MLDLVILCRVVPQYPVFELRYPFQDVLEWFAIFFTVKGVDWRYLSHNTLSPRLLTEAMLPVNSVGLSVDSLPLKLQVLCLFDTAAKVHSPFICHFPIVLPQPSCSRFDKFHQIFKTSLTSGNDILKDVQKLRSHPSNVRVLKNFLALGDNLINKRYVIFHNPDLVVNTLAVRKGLITTSHVHWGWRWPIVTRSDFPFCRG